MSIESNIAELTAAVKELTAAILAGQGKDSCAGKCQTAASEKPKAEAKKETAKTEPAQIAKQEPASTPPTAEAPATAPDAKAENSAVQLDYEKDVKPLFLKLVTVKGRDVAIGLIKSYKADAAKLNDAIGPEQYAEAAAKINELLAS